MTEPKEEKCEACCGSGYINFWTDDGHISMRTCRRCDGYGYIKVKPMTNEEWFCSLSTEEKAKFLFEHGVICCQFCKGDCIEIDYKTKECKYNTSPSYSYTGIVEWLKEKHDGSM